MVLVMITDNDQTMVSGEKNEVNVSSLCKKKSHTIGDDNGMNDNWLIIPWFRVVALYL